MCPDPAQESLATLPTPLRGADAARHAQGAAPEPPAKLQKIERPSSGSDEPAVPLCMPRSKALPKRRPAPQPLRIQVRDEGDGGDVEPAAEPPEAERGTFSIIDSEGEGDGSRAQAGLPEPFDDPAQEEPSKIETSPEECGPSALEILPLFTARPKPLPRRPPALCPVADAARHAQGAAPEPPAKLQKIERPSSGSDEPAVPLCMPRSKALPKRRPAPHPLRIQARDGDDGNWSLAQGPNHSALGLEPRRLDIQRSSASFLVRRVSRQTSRPLP